MKNRIETIFVGLAMASTIAYNALASGRESAGGDPKKVTARPFPNLELIKKSVDHLKAEIKRKPLPERFIHQFTNDLEGLGARPKEKFFYVPGLASFGYSRHGGDYGKEIKADGTITLFSIGAFTEFEAQAPIFMTDGAKDYGVEDLARVIAQEIPHHLYFHAHTALTNFTCTNRLRYHRHNETFVNRLGEQIAKSGGEIDKDILYALEITSAKECYDVVEVLEKRKSDAVTKLYERLADNLGVVEDSLVQDLIGKIGGYASTDHSTSPDVLEMVALRLWLEDFERTTDLKALNESYKRHFKLVPSEIHN